MRSLKMIAIAGIAALAFAACADEAADPTVAPIESPAVVDAADATPEPVTEDVDGDGTPEPIATEVPDEEAAG